MDPLVKVKAIPLGFKVGKTATETRENNKTGKKKKILINTNLVFREGSDISLCLLGENVKDNVWAMTFKKSHVVWPKKHPVIFSLSGGCVAKSGSRRGLTEGEERAAPSRFLQGYVAEEVGH